jgi:serine/threonine protein kinase
MHQTDPGTDNGSPLDLGAVNVAGTQATIDDDVDRLLDLLERWDELYRRHEIATPDTLGVDDPSLRALLLERIEERKRLYAFLRMSKLAADDEPAGSGTAPETENAGNGCGEDSLGAAVWIGRYLALEMLDEGRQGQVFRVVHPTLGKEFVLKLATRPVEVDDCWRERLLAEGRLLAACDHPNLVRVVDLDFHKGRPFVVMEHVRGVNLERYVEHRRPDPRAAARLVAELARAVSFINARGIVHQDIKPKNVLIDEQDRPRLIDFGLARHFDAWSGETPTLTGGTAAYMSPEQALGTGERIGPRTDVFGLGGVLYYLLTGQPVYQSASELTSLQRAMRAEQVAPRLVDQRISRSLERICLKALAPDPDCRYQTAGDLERALRQYPRRPKVLAIGVLVILSLLALSRFALPSPARTGKPTSAQVAAAPGVVVALSPAAALTIASFEVKHFRGDRPPMALGTIGDSSVPILFDDDVRVHARFSTSCYCYLIALNPDGKVQLCYPGAFTEAPPRVDEFAYPPGNLYFPLNDGTGLQAFVLLASRMPLPPFAQWEGRRTLHWEAVRTGTDGVGLWSFNGSAIEPLADGQRGQPRGHDAVPRPFKELCDWVRQLAGIEAARTIAFPVVNRGLIRSSQ